MVTILKHKTKTSMKTLILLIALVSISCIDNEASNATSILDSKTENRNRIFKSETSNDDSDFIRTVLYKGTMNGTIKIWLYLKEQAHPCGGDLTILNAMYKYDTQEKWILLDVTTDAHKKNYCMVEDGLTGVLFLVENETHFNGTWISPDTKRQFKIELEKVDLDKPTIEKLDETLFDDLLYNKNDC